jgi:hypothetical protein
MRSLRPLVVCSAAMLLWGGARAGPHDGDLYFVNMTGSPATLTVDHQEPRPVQHQQVLGYPLPQGGHGLHFVAGASAIDLHVTFDAANVAQDKYGRTYWCVISGIPTGPQSNGRIILLQVEPEKCSQIVALGNRPPN